MVGDRIAEAKSRSRCDHVAAALKIPMRTALWNAGRESGCHKTCCAHGWCLRSVHPPGLIRTTMMSITYSKFGTDKLVATGLSARVGTSEWPEVHLE